MRILRFLTISAIGFFLGFGLWRLTDLGYFQQWERLTLAPEDKTGYLTISGDQYPQSPVWFTKPCDYSKPEFSLLAYSPSGIIDCLQRSEEYPDGYGRLTYVLDANGDVWEWAYTQTAYTTLFEMICWPSSGLFIGVVIALLVESSKMYVNRTRTLNR